MIFGARRPHLSQSEATIVAADGILQKNDRIDEKAAGVFDF